MARCKSFVFISILLLSSFSLASCTLHRKGGGGGGGGSGAKVSFTVVADTVPANPSLLSFKDFMTSVVLTPSSGSAQTLTPATPVVDLMRLQSDSAFLGTLTSVPSGTYTVTVAFSNPEIVFLNDTTSTITAGTASCPSGSVCSFSLSASGTPVIPSFNFMATSSGQQGIGIDFNLKNAISLSSSGALSVNFNPSSPSPAVLSAFTLPRSNSNLSGSQLDLIEDFTGVVGLNGSAVTLTSPTRGTLTASAVSATNFDPDPSGTLCPRPTTTLSACVSSGQVASMDVILDSGGTFSVQEIEPLLSSQQDLVEGIVFAIGGTTQFSIALTDKIQAATNSLIGGLKTGDLLAVTIPASTVFLVDTKGLAVPAASLGLFQGQTDTSAMHQGQAIAIHVTAFTAASGTTIASATADTVTLRWSRLIANTTGAAAPGQINVNNVPSYFLITSSSVFPTQVFPGTPGADGVTNLEGIAAGGTPVQSPPPVGPR